MSKLLKHRPLRAVVAGCAGALVLAASMGGVASAAPVTPHNIDPDATANLVVVKQTAPSGAEANGLVNPGATNPPIAGVTFKVQKVEGIDLTTNQGWIDAVALTVPAAQAGTLDTGTELTTGANGVADFEGLDPGLYLVTETDQPSNVTPAAPFLVTLPMTHPDDLNRWILDSEEVVPGENGANDYYQVTVYPKNSTVTVTKTDNDGAAVELGDLITYTLKGDIPEINGDLDEPGYAASVYYAIADNYDTRLVHQSTGTPKIVDAAGGVVAEFIAADYSTVERNNPDGTKSQVVVLTVAGLKKLQANGTTAGPEGVRLAVDMVFKANATGEIPNTATVYPNLATSEWRPGETDPDIPVPPTTPQVFTKWGAIQINKTDAKEGDVLPDAKFQLYAMLGTAGNAALDKGNATLVDLNNDGTGDTFVTGPDGKVVINGLRYSDFANNAAITPTSDDYITYWLVEIEAPSGFELLAQPIKIELKDETLNEGATTLGVDVANSPHNGGFDLPLTGGSGTVALTVGGALLVGGVIVLIVRSARRHAAN